jgi:hypothetical protein
MRRLSLASLTLLLPLALAACLDDKDEDDDGDTGGNDAADDDCYPYCEGVEASISTSDETALGVTGAAVVDPLPASAETDIVWSDDVDAALTWGVAVATDTLVFVEQTAVYPECDGDAPSIGVDCPDLLRVTGTLTLESDDGRLALSMALDFELDEYAASEGGAVSFWADLDASDLGSGFVLEDFVDVASYDEVSISLYGWVSASGELNATIGGMGTGDDGDIAWAESIEIASIGGGGW